jgi:hypothetical protein
MELGGSGGGEYADVGDSPEGVYVAETAALGALGAGGVENPEPTGDGEAVWPRARRACRSALECLLSARLRSSVVSIRVCMVSSSGGGLSAEMYPCMLL